MRLNYLKVEKASIDSDSILDDFDVYFGRNNDLELSIAPVCIIGPNGSGKSQFLQLLAEIFQVIWHEYSSIEERNVANKHILFELSYYITPTGSDSPKLVTFKRYRVGKKTTPIELYVEDNEVPLLPTNNEFGKYLPSLIIGYTSGDNETLSLPFLVSRSSYANEVANTALSDNPNQSVADNKLVMIDYSTNLEVLFANMMLGTDIIRKEILHHAHLDDLASCRCVIRLAHSAVTKASKKQINLTGRKGIQLTGELEEIINALKATATCWNEDKKTETYTFDFLISNATREAFAYFWKDAFSLYRSLHKFALLNDLAIPRPARKRLDRAVNERRFASRLPEPQQEDMVFNFEEVRFWPHNRSKEPVDYVSLSDGEHQQTLILGMFAMISMKNAIFLLDEPESHFNPQWRTKFVQRLLSITSNRASQELLLTSHAPFAPSDMPREQVLIFSKDSQNKVTVRSPNIETFGATFDKILESCFGINPPISKIAESKINELLSSNDIVLIENTLNELGQSVEKAFLADHLRRLKKKL